MRPPPIPLETPFRASWLAPAGPRLYKLTNTNAPPMYAENHSPKISGQTSAAPANAVVKTAPIRTRELTIPMTIPGRFTYRATLRRLAVRVDAAWPSGSDAMSFGTAGRNLEKSH